MQNIQALRSVGLTQSSRRTTGQTLQDYIKSLSGLLAYYPLDETSGNAINQAPATIGTRDGTVTGATQGVAGQSGLAYSFDGVNDSVDCTNPTSPVQITLIIIFNMAVWPTGDDYSDLVRKESSFQIEASGNGAADPKDVLMCGIKVGGSAKQVQIPKAEITLNTPHILVVTADGSNVNAYLDGVARTPSSYTGDISNTAGNKIFLGTYGTNVPSLDRYYQGTLQHFAYTSSAISQSEVTTLAQLAGLA